MAISDRASTGTTTPRSRTLAKTVSYRALMVCITTIVAFFVTRDATAAVHIAIAANAVKTGTYYLHERAWDRVDWLRGG